MNDIKVDVVLDTKGLNCPLPVLKVKKAIDKLVVGQVMRVFSTDPITKHDIPALIKRMGHDLMQTKEDSGVIEFYIRKK